MKRKEIVNKLALGAVLTSAALGFGGCGKEPVEAVYGPPPDYYDEVEPAEPQGDTEYDPSSEEIEDVYGPPPFEEDEEDINYDEGGNPGDEMIEALYGPPPDDLEPVYPGNNS